MLLPKNTVGHDDGKRGRRVAGLSDERQERQFPVLESTTLRILPSTASRSRLPLKGRLASTSVAFLGEIGIGFAERVDIAELWVFDAVQDEVHGADADHGGVELHAHEHVFLEIAHDFIAVQFFFVVLPDVLARHGEEAATAGAGVADDVFQCGLHHIDHHADDVARLVGTGRSGLRRRFC